MFPGAIEQGDQLINKEEVLDYLADPRSLLSAGTLEDRKTLLTSFLRSVTRNGDEEEIKYLSPLPPGTVHLPSDQVLPTV